MEYEGQICRAPMERSSFMLPVMVGCAYNQCKFCNLFRELKYRELPMEQIEDELKRVKNVGGNPKRIFLGDGSAFGLNTEKLLDILKMIKQYFPEAEEINMDATITSIHHKSDEELKNLYEHGVRHLYIGIESGLDDVLTFMRKDHGIQEAYTEIARLQEAGLVYDAHIMTGVAGKGRGQENAKAMAEFIIRSHPKHIVNFSMFLHEEVPLYQDVKAGTFTPADEVESLREERTLLNLVCKGMQEGEVIKYDGFHDFLEVRVRGNLPEDGEKMIEKLDQAIAENEGKPPVYSYVHGECSDLTKMGSESAVWEMDDEKLKMQ